MTKRVLVTGGAGFIGSNLVRGLMEKNYEVHVVDDLSNGFLTFLPEHQNSERMLITSFDDHNLLNEIRSKKFSFVFHLAAMPRVSYSVENPLETHDANVTSTMKLLDACRGNVEKFVFASSSSIYGNSDQIPTKIDANANPRSPYALQKLIIEKYLSLYWDLYGFDSVALRFFNVFGPHQIGNSPYATAVSSWLNSIMKSESMRSDGDGSQVRDMCYVDNVVEACIKSAEYASPLKGRIFNVGCGENVSNKEILEYLLKRFPQAQFHTAPWRLGDVMATLADISHTRDVIGYDPKVPFWMGLDRTIKWYVENWDLIKNISNQ